MRALFTLILRYLPLLVAATTLLVMVLYVPAFHRLRYWMALPVQFFPAAAMALALTPIILTGGIDLSVGSTMVLSSVVTGVLWRDAGVGIELALVAGALAGGLCGLINGALVVVGVLPLVVTLATRELYRGLALTVTGGEEVRGMGADVANLPAMPLLGAPLALWALVAIGLISYLVVHHTWMGRSLFAMGDNLTAARFARLPVARLQLGLYAWAGLIAGLCGAARVMRFGSAKGEGDGSWELLAITCVVMGGVRVTGGAGHVGGVAVGIVTVGVLLAGLSSVASDWRDTVAGLVLIGMALATESAARWLERQPVRRGTD